MVHGRVQGVQFDPGTDEGGVMKVFSGQRVIMNPRMVMNVGEIVSFPPNPELWKVLEVEERQVLLERYLETKVLTLWHQGE